MNWQKRWQKQNKSNKQTKGNMIIFPFIRYFIFDKRVNYFGLIEVRYAEDVESLAKRFQRVCSFAF